MPCTCEYAERGTSSYALRRALAVLDIPGKPGLTPFDTSEDTGRGAVGCGLGGRGGISGGCGPVLICEKPRAASARAASSYLCRSHDWLFADRVNTLNLAAPADAGVSAFCGYWRCFDFACGGGGNGVVAALAGLRKPYGSSAAFGGGGTVLRMCFARATSYFCFSAGSDRISCAACTA